MPRNLSYTIKNVFMISAPYAAAFLPVLFGKYISYSYIICYHFADNQLEASFFDSIFTVSPMLNRGGFFFECTIKILFVLALTSLFRAIFSDPGYTDRMNMKMPKEIIGMKNKLENTCEYCNGIWKPPRAIHCFECKKCVMFGTHIPLITGCVGLKNAKFYMLLVLYLFLCYVMVDLLFIIDVIFWIANQVSEKQENLFAGWSTLWKVGSFLLVTFWGYIISSGIDENIRIIIRNESIREREKGECGRPGSLFQNLKKFFGTNIWAWLFPIAPKLHVNALELTYRHAGIIKDENGQEIYEEDDFKALKIYSKYWIN